MIGNFLKSFPFPSPTRSIALQFLIHEMKKPTAKLCFYYEQLVKVRVQHVTWDMIFPIIEEFKYDENVLFALLEVKALDILKKLYPEGLHAVQHQIEEGYSARGFAR